MKHNIKAFIDVINDLRFILDHRQKVKAVLLFVMMIIAAFFEMIGVSVVVPFITVLTSSDAVKSDNKFIQIVSDLFGIDNGYGLIVLVGLLVILVYLVKNIYLLVYQAVEIRYECQTQLELSDRMMRSYTKRPYSYFTGTNSAAILRGVNESVINTYALIGNLFTAFKQILSILMIGIYIFTLDIFMAIGLALVAIVSMVITTYMFKKPAKTAGDMYWHSLERTRKTSYQLIEGIKDVMVTDTTPYFLSEFHNSKTVETTARRKNAEIGRMPRRIIEIVFVAAIMILLLVKTAVEGSSTESITALATVAVAGFQLFPMISQVSSSVTGVVSGRPFLTEVKQIISDSREFEKNLNAQKKAVKTGIIKQQISFEKNIEMKNITFRYNVDGPEVLSNADLEIPCNTSVGIVGESGAGKSTISDILLGLLTPEKGRILIDGIDTKEISESLANVMGYVPQTVYLLDDTVRRNIAFGIADSDISDEKVWSALKRAQLEEYVKDLDDGLDTMVGERGVRFSGGQRQRIAIARAMYREPRILIMDEATSALDGGTENEVMEAIEKLHGDITMVIIAHRLSTIAKCDKVYEIKDGKAHIVDKEAYIAASMEREK